MLPKFDAPAGRWLGTFYAIDGIYSIDGNDAFDTIYSINGNGGFDRIYSNYAVDTFYTIDGNDGFDTVYSFDGNDGFDTIYSNYAVELSTPSTRTTASTGSTLRHRSQGECVAEIFYTSKF